MFLSIAAILVILPTVFIADLFCESCTLMFCFMSKSKVFKEILVLFNVVMEPAGNTKQAATVQQAGPGRVGSFCYICNKLTTLHAGHLFFCCGSESPVSGPPHDKEVRGQKSREGLLQRAPRAVLSAPGCGLLFHSWSCCSFGFLFLIYLITINYASHNIHQLNHKFMNI